MFRKNNPDVFRTAFGFHLSYEHIWLPFLVLFVTQFQLPHSIISSLKFLFQWPEMGKVSFNLDLNK